MTAPFNIDAVEPLQWLSREQAAAYITRRTGMQMSLDTLAHRAAAGTGPRYFMWGGKRGGNGRGAIYTIPDIEAWIQLQLHEPSSAGRADVTTAPHPTAAE